MSGAAEGSARNLRKWFAVGLAVGLAVYLGLGLAGDLGKLGDLSTSFAWPMLAPVLGLSLLNYGLRFLRWEYYLRRMQVRLPLAESFTVFLAGLMLTVTPGKLGEVLKAWLLKRRHDIPMARTASLVVAERFTDLTAVLLLALLGVSGLRVGLDILLAGAGMMVVFLGLVLWRRPLVALARAMERLPALANAGRKAEELLDQLSGMLRPGPFLLANGLGLLAWSAEALGFYLVLAAMPAAHAVLQPAFFVYAIATLAGAVSMLPGGLIATEGSMVGLLVVLGLVPDQAGGVFATLLIRLATLWFAVLAGALGFLAWRRVTRDRVELGAAELRT